MERGDFVKVKQLLHAAADPMAFLVAQDLAGSTVLHRAVCKRSAEVVAAVLQAGPDSEILLNATDHCGSTPPHAAAHLGCSDLCLLMLQFAIDHDQSLRKINDKCKTACEWSADFSTAHLLCTYRPKASLLWPDASAIQEIPDHLCLGITLQSCKEAP